MENKVKPGKLSGMVCAPTSKSYALRALLAVALSSGEDKGVSSIYNVVVNGDIESLISALRSLGVSIDVLGNRIDISEHLKPGASSRNITVGESALAVRLLAPVLSLADKPYSIMGKGTLLKRDMSFLVEALKKIDVNVTCADGYLPITLKGPIRPQVFELDCSSSSQFLSGLLYALPLCNGDSEIFAKNIVSRPYIDMTLSILGQFGIEINEIEYGHFVIKGNQKYISKDYFVEGDWSGISTILVSPGIKNIKGLNLQSLQADRKILDVLEQSNVNVKLNSDSLVVYDNIPSAFEFDATDCPDLFPALSVLAARAESGTSYIKGIDRLVNKESNRAVTIRDEFAKMGIEVKLGDDNVMQISGGQKIKSATVSSCGDHRIAMALASLALLGDGETVIKGAESVSKSYVNFWNDFNKLYCNE